MVVRVKVCGITGWEDAAAAVDAGADALGFVLAEGSPRRVDIPTIAAIVRRLPPFIARVGVFVDASPDTVRQVLADTGLDTVQFHGQETPADCAAFGPRVIKAFRMRDQTVLAELPRYPAAAWLLDSYVPGQMGGTGACFNWDLAREAAAFGTPIILAGGLTPANVAAAIQQTRPYGVDVSSGVEAAPGRKDHAKLRAFLAAVRSLNGAASSRA